MTLVTFFNTKQRNKYLTEVLSMLYKKCCWSFVKLYEKEKKKNYNFCLCKSMRNRILCYIIKQWFRQNARLESKNMNRKHLRRKKNNEKYNELNLNLFIRPAVDECIRFISKKKKNLKSIYGYDMPIVQSY